MAAQKTTESAPAAAPAPMQVASKKPAGKAPVKSSANKVAAKGAGKRKAGSRASRGSSAAPSFGIYLVRVLRQVHPTFGLNKRSLSIMQSMVVDIFNRISDESQRLTDACSRSTINAREIQSAVRLMLPGELSKHAISEGLKACNKYSSNDK